MYEYTAEHEKSILILIIHRSVHCLILPIYQTKIHFLNFKTVTEMALNPNIQSEDVKKEVSIVQNQVESLVDQIGSSLKELRNIIGNLEEKIRNHEKRLGVLQETLLAPILLRSLRDEQLVKLFKKLQQVSLKSHWPDVIENTRQFRRGSFSCCVEHLKAYVNQLLKNSK